MLTIKIDYGTADEIARTVLLEQLKSNLNNYCRYIEKDDYGLLDEAKEAVNNLLFVYNYFSKPEDKLELSFFKKINPATRICSYELTKKEIK